ncbi:hypothetical protein EDB19DRAFT_1906801 [Suillus lakei]|nr:hypothetical protein EDB19DRAFT_1906801 [Suillus lakei]
MSLASAWKCQVVTLVWSLTQHLCCHSIHLDVPMQPKIFQDSPSASKSACHAKSPIIACTHAVCSSFNFMLQGQKLFLPEEVDSILFLAMQTVCPFPSQVKPDFTHEDPDPKKIFQLRFNLSRYIQVTATPDDSELKYMGPLFQRLATIQLEMAQEHTTSRCLHFQHQLSTPHGILHAAPSLFLQLPSHPQEALPCTLMCPEIKTGIPHSADPRHPLSPSHTLIQSGLSDTHVCDIINALKPEVLGRCIGVVLDPKSSVLGILFPYLNCIRVPVWVQIGMMKGIFYKTSLSYSAFKLTIPRGEEELHIQAMIHKTIADDSKPSPSNPDPDSLHQWNALVEAQKSKHELFSSHASNNIKEQLKKRLQDTLNFIIPTQQDGMRFFMWYCSKQGRFRGELNYEDAKKEFESRQWEECVYDEISNQWDICSLFDKDQDLVHNDATFDHPFNPTPAPQLNNPPTLLSNHNELGRTVVHQTPIGKDM